MRKVPEAMRKIIKFTRELARDTRGSSAIEYALLATMASTALFMGAISIGSNLSDVTEESANEINEVVAAIDGATSSASDDEASDTGGN